MQTNYKSVNKKNIFLLLIALIIILIPLIVNPAAEYGGADGEAEGVIMEINPSYEPWFASLYEPPSGEIESLLFSTQAAIGAGVVGYYLGSRKKR